jgi:hypothetical protein
VGGVLLLSQRQVTAGKHFLVRWVSVNGVARDLADLPGEPLAGSWVWAPDGHEVAFLVRISTTALVALNIDSGELRYLDDLRADGLPTSGAVVPATWVPSGGLLYAAPTTGTGFPGSSGTSAPVLFEVAPGRIDSHRVGDVEPVWAPIVRADGVLLTLARGENDVLVLRPVDPRFGTAGRLPFGQARLWQGTEPGNVQQTSPGLPVGAGRTCGLPRTVQRQTR